MHSPEMSQGDAAWQRALLLAQQGRSELAIEHLRRLLTTEPEHVGGLALLARLLDMLRRKKRGWHRQSLRKRHG